MNGRDLHNSANRNVATAIGLDSTGLKAMAIEYYQRACDDIIRLTRIYDGNFEATRIWMDRASAYQNRIKALKASPF